MSESKEQILTDPAGTMMLNMGPSHPRCTASFALSSSWTVKSSRMRISR